LEVLILYYIIKRHPQISNFLDVGYAGAILKGRNFSGWQKKYNKSENYGYVGQC
jgi:hypothetical protein